MGAEATASGFGMLSVAWPGWDVPRGGAAAEQGNQAVIRIPKSASPSISAEQSRTVPAPEKQQHTAKAGTIILFRGTGAKDEFFV